MSWTEFLPTTRQAITASSEVLQGDVVDLKYYPRILTPAELREIYETGRVSYDDYAETAEKG